MKKTFRFLTMGLLAIGLLASCNKKENNNGGTEDGLGFKAITEQGGGNSKTHGVLVNAGTADECVEVRWTQYDEILVDNGTEVRTFELTGGENTTTGAFYTSEGSTFDFTSGDFYAIYPAANAEDVDNSLSGATATFTLPAEQSYLEGSFAEKASPMMAHSNNQTLYFKNVLGGICFPLLGDGEHVSKLVLTSNNTNDKLWGVFNANYNSGEPTLSHVSGGSNSITLTNCNVTLDPEVPTEFNIMLPPGTLADGFVVTAYDENDVLVLEKTKGAISADFISRNLIRVSCPLGVLSSTPCSISMSATKKIWFAKGNLQFSPGTGNHAVATGGTKPGTWRFAEHQYDRIHTADDSNLDNEYNENYTGWIDLFGWGTSGWDNTAVDQYSIYYHPWDTYRIPTNKPDNIHYDHPENFVSAPYDYNVFGYGPSSNNPVSPDFTGTYYDWGVYNTISNGEGYDWYTPTYDEWHYMLFERTVKDGCCDDKAPFGLGRVYGVFGVIILPDNWTGGVDFTYGNTLIDDPANLNVFSDTTTPTWEQMEAAGVVFLPITGVRRHAGVSRVDEIGIYWTSNNYTGSAYSGDSGSTMRVGIDRGVSMQGHERSYGFPVRLVRNAN